MYVYTDFALGHVLYTKDASFEYFGRKTTICMVKGKTSKRISIGWGEWVRAKPKWFGAKAESALLLASSSSMGQGLARNWW
jgi:hypothetical protein